MRIRTIKPEFFTHEAIFEAEMLSGLPLRLTFIGLWCAADREGRFKWEPRRLGVQILPYDKVDFAGVLDALVTGGFIVKYRVGNAWFGVIPSFKKHQIVNNREAESSLPAPEVCIAEIVNDSQANDACPTREQPVPHASKAEGKGREQGKEQGREQEPASPWVVKFGLEMPESLRTQPCLDAVNLWLKYKAERREPYKETGLRMALSKWGNEFTADEFPACVEHSSAQGWQGIYRPRTQNQGNGRPANPLGTKSPDDGQF